MENNTVAFCTLGCKVNQYETNGMIQKFKENNYNIVEFDKKADIYIINTCTVTNMADRKSRQMLRRVKELNPQAMLVAVGCYAQVAKDELEKIPEIDLILGTNEKKDVVKFIQQFQRELANIKGIKLTENNNLRENEYTGKKISKPDELNKKINNKAKQDNISDVMRCEEYADFGDVTFTEKTRAVIKVQDGCDRFCSYCIIPFARGHIRSRNPESVVSEITKIAKKGIKEIVITGIHLASYGRDLQKENTQDLTKNEAKSPVHYESEIKKENKETNIEGVDNNSIKDKGNHNNHYGLIDLLENINKLDGIKRIRLRIIRTNFNYRRICTEIIKTRENM